MFEDISKVILVSDMDGTLLNSKKEISEKDKTAIDGFIKRGGHFTVATGRTIQSFEPYNKMLKLKMPVIMYNGAMIYDFQKQECLYSVYLPEEAKEIALEIMANVDGLGGEILKQDGTYIFENNEYEKHHTKVCNIIPKFCRLEDMSSEKWLKVLFAAGAENLQKLVDFIGEKRYNRVSFVKSASIFYEMLTPDTNKGEALKIYRNLDGMKDFTFVSAGDFNNDLELLQMADLGAAPSNAQPEVKAVADVVLENSCNEGAIAELIDIIYDKLNIS